MTPIRARPPTPARPGGWKDGAAVTLTELGDPPGGDGYTLCLYDESAATEALVFRATVASGGTCHGAPCWHATGSTGFRHANRAGIPDGVLLTRLKAGEEGEGS